MKKKVKRIVITAIVALAVVAAVVLYVVHRYQGTSAKRPKSKYKTEMALQQSSVDRDGDGIDDQTDILQGALEYAETKPKYKSQYYAGGYPDDEYGVCTDVVAFALLHAGYDLKELVSEDIAKKIGRAHV